MPDLPEGPAEQWPVLMPEDTIGENLTPSTWKEWVLAVKAGSWAYYISVGGIMLALVGLTNNVSDYRTALLFIGITGIVVGFKMAWARERDRAITGSVSI